MKALVMVKRIYFDNDTHEILITEEDIKQLAIKKMQEKFPLQQCKVESLACILDLDE